MPQSIQDLINHTPDEEAPEEKLQAKLGDLKLQDQELITQETAEELGLSYINLQGFPIGPEVIGLIPEADSRQGETLCFFHQQSQIRLATYNPDNPNIETILDDLKERYPHSKIRLYLTSKNSFDHAFKLYKGVVKIKKVSRDLKISTQDLDKFKTAIDSFADLNQSLKHASVTDIFTMIIAAAINFNSSDIHIEAEDQDIKVRFRLDGVLQEVATLPLKSWPQVISRIKSMAHLKINITDQPQDGRITIKMKGEQIDIRVSTLPSAFGESAVMRLLSSKASDLQFEKLGIRTELLEKLKQEIHRPNGMILTTGPTGSGKTTTLYAILNEINTPENKAITLEDPVEYKIPGITQSQVDLSKNYTFSKGLKSLLRQDPDIVMVGEIRDLETADTAIQASLTGHLMLSTVHTNDAAGAVPRLLSIGVKPFLLAPALNAVIGQRLVRRLCDHCKMEDHLAPEKLAQAKTILEKLPPNGGVKANLENLKFYKSQGCPKCNKTGYQGRIGIYEIFIVDKDVEAVILSGEISEYKMRDIAISKGMITMAQDGLLKAAEGITSVDEVFRVTEQK